MKSNRSNFAGLIAVTGLFLFCEGSIFAQGCVNCCLGTACSNMCCVVCLDGMTCRLGQPYQCSSNQPYCPASPIIIDSLDEGFHLTGIKEGVNFSFTKGDPIQTSWTDAKNSNGWLALDRKGNGVIDDASELFGDLTPQPPTRHPNGYKALAVFDDPKNGRNGNGRIDLGDPVYSSLRLWVDRNHNGISEPSELLTLPEAGVFSISLHYKESDRVDQFGNEFRFVAPIWDQYGADDPKCYDVLLMTVPSQLKELNQSGSSNTLPVTSK